MTMSSVGSVVTIGFGAGPGSFTGLRIACGVAQGLALGLELPVVGVGTLEALAEQCRAERVIAALDARMGEVYHGAYERDDGRWRAVREPSLCQPRDAPQVPEAVAPDAIYTASGRFPAVRASSSPSRDPCSAAWMPRH